MTKYQKNDKIKFTQNTSIPLSAFHSMTVRKDTELEVVTVESNYYEVMKTSDKSTFTILQSIIDGSTVVIGTPVSGKRYSMVISTGLTYGKAVDMAIHEGKKVTRAIWDGYWCKQVIAGLQNEQLVQWKNEFLVAVLKSGGYAIATPYQEDMHATDWMIVE